MRTMTLRPLNFAALLALLAAPAIMHAQAEISSNEELRLEALAREQAEMYLPRNKVSIGFRMLSSGAKVKFTNLGSVGFGATVAPISDGAVKRTYDNGLVDVDTLRANERDADGIQTSAPGGRYFPTHTDQATTTDANGNVIGTVTTVIDGNFLSYTPGLTRVWSFGSADQAAVRPGFIAMSSYSAVSDGASMAKKQGPVGGIELQFSHMLGKVTGRTQWSFLTGISMNDINNKTAGDVRSTLRTNTDFYSLNGLTAPELTSTTDPTTGFTTTTPYTGPSYINLTDAAGNNLVTNGFETTVPVSAVPSDHVETASAGAATVHGRWQVKGAYFMVKVGPSMRTQLTERLGFNASLGLAGAYSGTHYSAVESFEIPSIGTTVTTPATEESDANKFLGGYYADMTLEWAANDSTGLFGGITAQKLGNYDQTVGGRTAHIDFGSAVGVRGGISIKF